MSKEGTLERVRVAIFDWIVRNQSAAAADRTDTGSLAQAAITEHLAALSENVTDRMLVAAINASLEQDDDTYDMRLVIRAALSAAKG